MLSRLMEIPAPGKIPKVTGTTDDKKEYGHA
jgi:hypothetical protein